MRTPTRSIHGTFRGREWARPTLSAERGGISTTRTEAPVILCVGDVVGVSVNLIASLLMRAVRAMKVGATTL